MPANTHPVIWLLALAVVTVPPTIITYLTRRDTKAVKAQVQNSHSTNLREELDDRHDEIISELAEVRRHLGQVDVETGRLDVECQKLKAANKTLGVEITTLTADLYATKRHALGVIAKHHPEDVA
ncbi:hypothetical protein [Gordonia sp. DT101]|uniref:hypothetical protein n=1 Tax=Gordonia sp. DT101 TaxID=3416545 RepID=UPI003CF3EC54